MRHQDWNAVVETHIRAAGGDPRFVLKSMDGELEKIAGLIDWGARQAGRMAVGAGERLGGYGLTRGMGAGLSRWGGGVFERQVAKAGVQEAASVARTGAIRDVLSTQGPRMSSSLQARLGREATSLAQGRKALRGNVTAWNAQASRGTGNAASFTAQREADAAGKAVLSGKPLAPPAPAPAVAPAVDPARLAAGSPQAAAGAVNPAVAESMKSSMTAGQTYNAGVQANVATKAAATPADIAGAPLWNQAQTMWKGWTPGQQMGAVAGAAAIPALGAGLMMGGGGQRGNTTIIQR